MYMYMCENSNELVMCKEGEDGDRKREQTCSKLSDLWMNSPF